MAATPFSPGELALLLDAQGNRYLVRLAEGETLHHHLGAVRHADVIGRSDGAVVRSNQGARFAAVRPRLVDYVLEMPRRSGIVYPKDAAQLLAWGDIGPGLRVAEAGVGSGALTLVLLRAVGERGQVIGYEQRGDLIELALSNVRAFAEGGASSPGPGLGNLLVRERDVYDGLIDTNLDRVVLDLPEPWRVVAHLPGALRPGGWLCAYTPSIIQAAQLVEAIRAAQRFAQVETQEVLVRGWHIQGAAVRPEQQMVGHTGFLTLARLVEPDGT